MPEPITFQVTLSEDTWIALNQQKVDVTLGQASTMGVTLPTDPEFMADILTRYAEGRQIHFYQEGNHLVYALTDYPIDYWYPVIRETKKEKEKEETYDDPN